MKILLIILVFFIFLPFAAASMSIEASVSDNDVVTEDFTIIFTAEQPYDSFKFISVSEPLSIIYDDDFEVTNDEEGYAITFSKQIEKGINIVEFSILYDNLVQKIGSGKVLRTSFISSQSDLIDIKINLPEGYYLSGQPSTSPEPAEISSDGQQIMLEWDFVEKGSIVIFYETNQINVLPFIVVVIIIIVIVMIYLIGNKKKIHRKMDEMLSDDENKVIAEIKAGTTMQKEIAQKLEFSKSKMSKVARKIEEKGVIERTPHFKTNILKMKK